MVQFSILVAGSDNGSIFGRSITLYFEMQAIAVALSSVAYGLGVVLYSVSAFHFHKESKRRKKSYLTKLQLQGLLLYSTLMVALSTVSVVQQNIFTSGIMVRLIHDKDVELVKASSDPSAFLWIFGGPAMSSFPLVIWGSQAFLMWRCTVYYRGISTRFRRVLLSFLFFIPLEYLASGVVFFVLNALPSPPTFRPPIIIIIASTHINLVLAVSIHFRILEKRFYNLGKEELQARYSFRIFLIMSVESSSLILILNCAYGGLYINNFNPGYLLLFALLPQAFAASSMLPVYGLATGTLLA